ncbi:MAG TPA: hypothetical protein VMV90_14980 [Rectinemataceae bacterium]|nr:hypothetical protein [Rectinemataceae bacterium]
MSLLFLAFVALRILGLAFFVALAMRLAAGHRRRTDPGLAALERRFVTGGLDEKEFRRMREVLES